MSPTTGWIALVRGKLLQRPWAVAREFYIGAATTFPSRSCVRVVGGTLGRPDRSENPKGPRNRALKHQMVSSEVFDEICQQTNRDKPSEGEWCCGGLTKLGFQEWFGRVFSSFRCWTKRFMS